MVEFTQHESNVGVRAHEHDDSMQNTMLPDQFEEWQVIRVIRKVKQN
jgi:hypothetical protein